MADDAFSFYCKKRFWERCDLSNLIIVELPAEKRGEKGRTEPGTVYKCKVCGGFFKRQYSATNYPTGLFDTEACWHISDKYFKIEQPQWESVGSTGEPPLTLGEARLYGYAGADHTWKNNRCNFNLQNIERTCRGIDLQFVADVSPASKNHHRQRFYKCRRCGEWYLFVILPPYTEALLKPSNELFPIDEARKLGYDETKIQPDSQYQASVNKTPAKPNEFPVTLDEWLETERTEKDAAEYAFLIVKKHFARANLKLNKNEQPEWWSAFGWDLYFNIHSPVRSEKQSEMLKLMLVELVDFCEAAFGESLAYHLFVIIERFVDRDPLRSLFIALLPAKALEKLDEVDEIMRSRHKQDLERQNQSGY